VTETNLQSKKLSPRVGDDIAYVLPMGCFLLFTWAGGQWPAFYPWSYVLKTVATAALLWFFWKQYTPISWRFAGIGVLIGIVGVFQWVGMEHFLLSHWPNYPRLSHEAYVPSEHFQSPLAMWSFIAVRWAGASLVVPVMEELFWRDFLWRTILAPNDFKLADVGEWNLSAFLTVALIFGAGVHIEWMTAIVWGLMIGALLVWTKSLGACIIAHGVTNFLLGAYVLHTGQWIFW
jgi:CAAX prenyl protease-like protein